jgi:hypothetical protein
MTPGATARRRRGRQEDLAPLWVMSFADLMSLLLILFISMASMGNAEGERLYQRSKHGPVTDGTSWTRIGRVRYDETIYALPPRDQRDLEEWIKPRIAGSPGRIALLGFAATNSEAYELALDVRSLLIAEEIEASRFLVVSAAADPSSPTSGTVEIYATMGTIGPR